MNGERIDPEYVPRRRAPVSAAPIGLMAPLELRKLFVCLFAKNDGLPLNKRS
jgi:hypothetical protein